MLRSRVLGDWLLPHRRGTCVALLVCAGLTGCTFLRGRPSHREGQGASGSSPSAVEVRDLEERPRLSLLRRTGDPAAATAVAVAHDEGSLASASMAALLEQRLRRDFTDLDTIAHNGGYVVRAVVTSPAQAARFITAASNALRTPVTDQELDPVSRRLKSSSFETWANEADAAVGRCSGELGLSASSPGASTLDRKKLEGDRIASYSSQAVAFAAVGPRAFLDSSSEALASTPPWPDEPEPENEWPAHDVIGVSASRLSVPSLSVALRVPDPARALGAARRLADRDSTLSIRVDALEPSYRIEEVAAATHPRGACIRVDLKPPRAEAAPNAAEAAWVAALVVDEMVAMLSRTPSDAWFLDDGVIRASDPRDAAAIAAWRALSSRLEPGPQRLAVRYSVPSSRIDRDGARVLANEFANARNSATRSTVELVSRVEKGQGQFWMLLGSPCGTASESTGDAGRHALLVRTLAEQNPRIDGVGIEPWITPDGVGLLAHASRASAAERPEALAERVATALGRAFSATRVSERHAAAVRTGLQETLDPERAPLWSVALEALAPGHPSWLDPRGTWQSMTAQSGDDAEHERRAMLRGPLRLAVIANQDDAQVRSASQTLERWLRPVRRQQVRCAATASVLPRIGEYAVETTAAPDGGARALVAAPFNPSPVQGVGREAEWTLVLLNRQGGWLDRALRLPGLASQAQAVLLGGRAAAGFVIEVGTLGEHARDAVAQVRALLSRLAKGAASNDDIEAARRYYAGVDAHSRLDPRRRVVDLWLSRPSPAPPDLSSLRRFHQLAFSPDRHIVVVEKPKP